MSVVSGRRGRRAESIEVPVAASQPSPLHVLFVLPSLGSLRHFQTALEALTDRGHTVRLLLEGGPQGGVHKQWLEGMLQRPNFLCETRDLKDKWHRRSTTLRRAMEYVQFLGPEWEGRPNRLLAMKRPPAPAIARAIERPRLRGPRGLRAVHRALTAVERAMPAPARVADYLQEIRPDVVALGDYSSRGSLHPAFVRAATALGIPTASCIRSWDNLSTRPRMTAVPHAVLVWNETQRQEAVELHGIPRERVVVTGAPNFDDWFCWQPRLREEFLAPLGLDPAKPVVLWVGGVLFFERRPEAQFAAEWLAALRSSSDPNLRDAGVLLRPHPRRVDEWLAVDFSRFENVALWQENTKPIASEQKADYYDSIFHSSAVVGINTSAMIEAAVVGRPVLTVLHPDFRASQLGSLHFAYLLESDGGPVRAAVSLEEHFSDLGAILAGQNTDALDAGRRFVRSFVRPHGLDRPAAALFCEALEQLAGAPVEPAPDSLWVVGLRRLVVAAADAPARRRRLAKRTRRLVKRTRRAVRALRGAAAAP